MTDDDPNWVCSLEVHYLNIADREVITWKTLMTGTVEEARDHAVKYTGLTYVPKKKDAEQIEMIKVKYPELVTSIMQTPILRPFAARVVIAPVGTLPRVAVVGDADRWRDETGAKIR